MFNRSYQLSWAVLCDFGQFQLGLNWDTLLHKKQGPNHHTILVPSFYRIPPSNTSRPVLALQYVPCAFRLLLEALLGRAAHPNLDSIFAKLQLTRGADSGASLAGSFLNGRDDGAELAFLTY